MSPATPPSKVSGNISVGSLNGDPGSVVSSEIISPFGVRIRCSGMREETRALSRRRRPNLPDFLDIRKIRNMSTYKRSRRESRSRVSATEAAKTFGRLVDRVREERATYVVERGGKPVARIAPIERDSFTMADFKTLMTTSPRIDEEYLKATDRAAAQHNRPRKRKNPWAR